MIPYLNRSLEIIKMNKERTKQGLRILAIHRHYWPDTPPYASILRSIVLRWTEDGHKVEVLSTQPSYKQQAIPRQPAVEYLDGIRVRRLSLLAEKGRLLRKVFNIGIFSVAIIVYAILRRRFDVIMASTAPPVLTGFAARIAAKLTGAKFVYHCMDIHPEIGSLSGEFSHPLLFDILRRIDASNCRNAAAVVVLSRDMLNSVNNRQNEKLRNVVIINNFSLPFFGDEEIASLPVEMSKSSGVFRVVFTGNIGRFQGLDTAVAAMHQLVGYSNIELMLLGEGKALPELKLMAGALLGKSVKFFPHQPSAVAKALIRSADICLVSLIPELYKYAYPSKTMTYLCEGRPLLVAVEQASEIAGFVCKEGIGMCVQPGDIDAMAGAIRILADKPHSLDNMASCAKGAGKAKFDTTTILAQWSQLINNLQVGKE